MLYASLLYPYASVFTLVFSPQSTIMAKRIILLPILLFYLQSLSQSNTYQLSPEAVTNIDALFADFNSLQSPGYALGISKEGQTLYEKGYGAANLDYALPIQPNSAFSIASVSKQFTAACIALLILEGKLSLETPASTFIPELKKYPHPILVKHLVYNCSGLNDYHRLPRKSGKSWVTFNYFDIAECIETSLAEDTLLFKPGEQWDYCNVNFMLLSRIVEQVSQQSFPDFIEEHLFTPLGMDHSLINHDITQIIPRRVTPYNLRSTEYVEAYREAGIKISSEGKFLQHPRNSPHYGGSGVVSSVQDLLKWAGNFYTKKWGGQAFYDLMHQQEEFPHGRNNQAMGLYFGESSGKEFVAWDGGDYGISSQLIRFPKSGIAIVVLSNLGSGEAYRKAYQIAEILIQEGLL